MKGFTLVELLVSISIFTVITSVAIFNHSQFNGSVLLTNLSYEIALSVRQAQSYGISVRENSAQNFNSGYGVHFDTTVPTQYILFEDKTGGTPYVHDGSDIDIQTYTIEKGNKVAKVCLDGVKPCSSTSVDISFSRPNPDAYIYSGGTNHGKAEICVTSPQGLVRKIIVESTGQISVDTDVSGICN
jgi:prepilin-type N-terminal cleavage/methylation domain-containing protein